MSLWQTMGGKVDRISFHGSRTLNDERVKIIILEELEKPWDLTGDVIKNL